MMANPKTPYRFPMVCSHKLDVIKNCYEMGSKTLGFNLIDQFCKNYFDVTVPLEIAQKCKSPGMCDCLISIDPSTKIQKANVILYETDWIDMISNVIKLGSRELKLDDFLLDRNSKDSKGWCSSEFESQNMFYVNGLGLFEPDYYYA
jgi:hypothetical protein